jgi:hypothetical protein
MLIVAQFTKARPSFADEVQKNVKVGVCFVRCKSFGYLGVLLSSCRRPFPLTPRPWVARKVIIARN